jgi:hypothetical protein
MTDCTRGSRPTSPLDFAVVPDGTVRVVPRPWLMRRHNSSAPDFDERTTRKSMRHNHRGIRQRCRSADLVALDRVYVDSRLT